MSALRVVITAPWGERVGGAEAMLWELMRHVDRRALDPTVVFFEPGGFQRDIARLGHATAVIPTGRLREPQAAGRAVRSLTRLLRAAEPAIIVNWSSKTHLYGAVAAVAAGMRERVVWWQHGVPHRHWMDRLATALPAAAIGCSSAASAQAQERLRPTRPTFVVHPGIDLEPRPATPPERVPAIPGGRTVIGVVGRLQPWKGQHHVISTIAILRDRGHEVHGLVIGGAPHGFSAGYEAELRARTAELRLTDRVTFLGHVADTRPYLDRMDVLVSASTDEPFGIVLTEAMAASRPVVAVASAGPLEIVVDGETGFLVDAPEPSALADALERLIDDPNLMRRMGEQGRRRCHERFSAQRMAVRFERELAHLARRSGSTD
jgi:glycosyltransferase involved in cell wall biosynthesis